MNTSKVGFKAKKIQKNQNIDSIHFKQKMRKHIRDQKRYLENLKRDIQIAQKQQKKLFKELKKNVKRGDRLLEQNEKMANQAYTIRQECEIRAEDDEQELNIMTREKNEFEAYVESEYEKLLEEKQMHEEVLDQQEGQLYNDKKEDQRLQLKVDFGR